MRKRITEMGKANRNPLARVEHISQTIVLLRGQRVILDSELGALYGVSTKRLNEQVKRNADRFPDDFLFRLSRAESDALNRSQIATGSQKHGNPRYPPFAFTEHGAIMAATNLTSPLAVEMSVYVVRAFVLLRDYLASSAELARS
jgi:ORF6N domain